MGVTNQDWYNSNASRSYPIDDSASGLDDNNQQLPHHLITDLYLRFPQTAGRYAFFSAVTATPNLVTVTILSTASPNVSSGTDTPATPIDPLPLAAISLPRSSLTLRRCYLLDSLYPGAGGWIVFGPGIDDPAASYRFSAPSQSLIMPRCAQAYTVPPVRSLGKINSSTALQGVIELIGGNDITITKEAREIGNHVADAAVFRLKDKATVDSATNIFQKYQGPCGARPESGNCGSPEPMEFLAGVGPDCCGRVVLELRGCAQATPNADNTGMVLSCNVQLHDACASQTHPVPLPTPADDCAGLYDISDIVPILPGPGPLPPVGPTPPSTAEPITPTLPYYNNLDSTLAFNALTLVQGTFYQNSYNYSVPLPPGEISPIPSGRGGAKYISGPTSAHDAHDLLLWDVGGPSWSVYYTHAQVDVLINNFGYGDVFNAYLLTNYVHTVSGSVIWWGARIVSVASGLYLQLVRSDGGSISVLASVFMGQPSELAGYNISGTWVRLNLFVVPAPAPDTTGAVLSAVVSNADRAVFAGWSEPGVTSLSATYVPNFTPGRGPFGFGTSGHSTAFDNFGVEKYHP